MSDYHIHTINVCVSVSERENMNESERERERERDGQRKRWTFLCCIYFEVRRSRKQCWIHACSLQKYPSPKFFSPGGIVKISFHPHCLVKTRVWQVSKSQNVNLRSPLWQLGFLHLDIDFENLPFGATNFSYKPLKNEIKQHLHAIHSLDNQAPMMFANLVFLIKTTTSNQVKTDIWHKSNHPSD